MPVGALVPRAGALASAHWPNPEGLAAEVFFTTRRGGVSPSPYDEANLARHVGDEAGHVDENRRRLTTLVGGPVTFVQQVHGATILPREAVTPTSEADGLISDGEAVAILVADCLPVAILNPARRQLAALHAGWRGFAAGILEAGIDVLGPAAELHVVIGPSISGARYQVGPEVVAAHPRFAAHARADVDERFLLDLRTAARDLFVDAGVPAERVFLSREVTDGGATFFSDRAQRPTGRFAMVARWT